MLVLRLLPRGVHVRQCHGWEQSRIGCPMLLFASKYLVVGILFEKTSFKRIFWSGQTRWVVVSVAPVSFLGQEQTACDLGVLLLKLGTGC